MGLLFATPVPALAAEAAAEHLKPLNFKGLYECSFAGVTIGKLGIEINQTPAHYDMTSDIVSSGLLKVFVNHSSHTVVSGDGANYAYPKVDYETHYQTKKKKKSAIIHYKDGKFASEEVLPPDNHDKRPAVSDDLKSAAVDPLSLLIDIRKNLFEAQKDHKDSFSLTIYDGHRLTEMTFAIKGKMTIMYKEAQTAAIQVDVSRKLLGGYTETEMADFNPKEPPLHIYFSDDDVLLPLRLDTKLFMGNLIATLTKQCGKDESCLLGNKE